MARIVAPTCDRATVQKAVDIAKSGDTVFVHAGTATWNSPVNVTGKAIRLIGSTCDCGAGNCGWTQINYGGLNHGLFVIDTGTDTGLMEVTGFSFQGGDPDYWGGTAIWFNAPAGSKNLRIHHNQFIGNKEWSVRGSAACYGLIDHNTFSGSAHGIEIEGRGDLDWTTPLLLGTGDFFFVEDNIFNWDDWYGSTGAVCVDFVDGGRVVFRHNTVTNGFMETHDQARSGKPSGNAWEVYSNTFTSPTNKWKACDIAGGTGVIWDNHITGDWTVPIGGIDSKTDHVSTVPKCDGTDPNDQNVAGQSGWRCRYQIGSQNFGAAAIGVPAYIWSNTLNGAAIAGMVITEGASHVQAGRDFFNSAKPGYAPYTYPHPLAT